MAKQKEGGGKPPVKKKQDGKKDIKAVDSQSETAVQRMQKAAMADNAEAQTAADVTAELNRQIAQRTPVTIKPLEGATPAYNDVLAQCVSLELEALFNSVYITWKIGSIVDPWITRQAKAKNGTRQELMEKVVTDLQSVSSVQLGVNAEKIRTACRLAQLSEAIVKRGLDNGLNQKEMLALTSKNVTEEMQEEIIDQVSSGEVVKRDVPKEVKDRVDAVPPEERAENRGGDRKSPERKDPPPVDPLKLLKRCNKQIRTTVDDLDGPKGQHDAFVEVLKHAEDNPDLVADFQRELKIMAPMLRNLGLIFQDMRSAANEAWDLDLTQA